MVCYRYMSYERFKQSIKPSGVFIKVSRPVEFNDPYDCSGLVVGKASEHLVSTYKQFFHQWLEPVELDFTTKVQLRRMFDGLYRILSFCDSRVVGTPEEMLMWSHYADHAQGVRVGIDVDTKRYRSVKILYKKQLPVMRLNKVKDWSIYEDPELTRFLRACLTTKHKSWQYEKERRVVFRVNDPYIKPLTLMDSVGPQPEAMMVWTPEKSVVKSICLGAEFWRASNSNRGFDGYLQSLKDAGYSLDVWSAVPRQQYGYDERPYTAHV